MRPQVARATGREVVGEPSHGVSHGGVLDDQVTRTLEPLCVCVRQPALQVAQVAVGEDRVSRPPDQQRRYVAQSCQALGDLVEGRPAGVVRFEGYVGDEVGDGLTPRCLAVRRPVGVSHPTR